MAGVGYRDRVLKALPGSRPDIEKKTGVSKNSVWRWITEMHKAGEIHISDWKRPAKGRYMPVYSVGKAKDAECKIVPFTEAEKAERHRQLAKKDGRWDKRMAKCRAAYWAERAMTKPDPLVAGLFGSRLKQKTESA